MTVQDAVEEVIRKWHSISEQALKCRMRIDDALTEEYDWGWMFTLVPVDPVPSSQPSARDRYAIDNVTGISTPVGFKGVPEAVRYLMKWRQKRAEAAGG